jgi:UDP-glucose 4-epimerase
MKLLVTGAAGFIGSTLVDRLLADGHEVTGVDDLSSGSLDNLAVAVPNAAFTFHEHDISAEDTTKLVASAAPEVVIHLAAQMDVRVSVRNPQLDARINILGLINVLEGAVAASSRKLVLASSGGTIYGSPASNPVPESAPLAPESPYATSKIAGEYYLKCYQAMHGLTYSILALGNVFGARQTPHGEAGVVSIFGAQLLAGEPTTIFGDGTSCRDYVYVDDVVDAIRHFSGDPGSGLRINIGTGYPTPIRDVHTAVARAVGVPDDPDFGPARTGEVYQIAVDPALAGSLGWSPKVTFDGGIARTVEWLRAGVRS